MELGEKKEDNGRTTDNAHKYEKKSSRYKLITLKLMTNRNPSWFVKEATANVHSAFLFSY